MGMLRWHYMYAHTDPRVPDTLRQARTVTIVAATVTAFTPTSHHANLVATASGLSIPVTGPGVDAHIALVGPQASVVNCDGTGHKDNAPHNRATPLIARLYPKPNRRASCRSTHTNLCHGH